MTSMFWLQLYKSVSKAILHGYEFSDICVKFFQRITIPLCPLDLFQCTQY